MLRDKVTRDNPELANAERLGYSTHGIPPQIVEYLADDENGLYRFPRELAAMLDEPIEDRTVWGRDASFPEKITLRPYQVEPVSAMTEELRTYGGGVLKAPPGAGKTVCSLKIAGDLGRKTVVLVHKSFLLNQWADRIEEFLGVKAGVVWQDRYETDAPIVVAMMQTLNARDFGDDFYRQFGLVIVDETHRAAADSFRDAVVKFPARYRLGVTATPERKDELEWIFFAHIGPIAVEMEIERDDPEVYLIPTPLKRVDEHREGLMRAGKPDFVKTVTAVVESEARNDQILEFIADAYANGRRAIVFSDRRKHLEALAESFADLSDEHASDYGFYVGGMTEKQRDASASKQVLFSTYQFAQEGLDIAELDTCVLASPKSSIIQVVGRIQRVVEGKPRPIVVDFVDEGLTLSTALARKRLRQYADEGWTIHDWRYE